MTVKNGVLLILTAGLAWGWGQAAEAPSAKPGFRVDVWQTEDGLPQNSIPTILQTRDGYLWLGTYQGLVRFDGVRFRIFDTTTTSELKSNRILKLHEDREGALWVGTEGGGLARYKDGRFSSFSTPDGLEIDTISALHVDGRGELWVGTISGKLHHWRRNTFVSFTLITDSPGNAVLSIAEGSNGRLWIATPEYVGYFHDGEFVPMLHEADRLIYMSPDRQGGLWVISDGELKRFKDRVELANHGKFPAPRTGIRVTSLLEDRKGNVWIGTYGEGLVLFRDGVFSRIDSTLGLSNDIILSIYEDMEGHIWVGTNGGGLIRLKEPLFEVYDSSNGLSENVVLSVCEGQDGSMWFGTDGGGLNRLKDGQFTIYGREEGLRSANVWSVFEDSQGVLWIGTWGGGLHRFKNDAFETFRSREGPSSQSIRAITEDRQGRIWIGTYDGGLSRFHERRFQNYNQNDGLSHNHVRVLHEARDGSFWIGTGGGGLNELADRQPIPFRHYQVEDGLPSNFIRAIHESADGALWIGTGSGLCRLKDGQFARITVKQGLPDNVISQILDDQLGYLWIGSQRGIFRVNFAELSELADGERKRVHCILYDKSDGLKTRECTSGSQPSACRSRDGRLWFPTMHGVAVIDPARVKIDPNPPSVILEDFLVDGESVGITHGLRLPPGKERFEFNFTAISFASPRRIRFQYKLEGYDLEWRSDLGASRRAVYTDLPPGEYQFRIQACNNDGVWNTTGQSLALTIAPPFWRTWWFNGAMSLAFVIGVAGTIRYWSLQKLQRQLELLEQQSALERERARIAKDMHDDLGANLTQIGLLSELVKRDAARPETVQKLATRLAATTREVAETLDEIVWAVNPRNDTLNRFVAYILHYAEEFFELTPLHCRMEVAHSLPDIPLATDVRHNLFLVVKEALNNIAKHAGATEVWLRIGWKQSILEIAIEDNGRGFDQAAASPTGNGLINMRKRVQDVHGRFELVSQKDHGTILRIFFHSGPQNGRGATGP